MQWITQCGLDRLDFSGENPYFPREKMHSFRNQKSRKVCAILLAIYQCHNVIITVQLVHDSEYGITLSQTSGLNQESIAC